MIKTLITGLAVLMIVIVAIVANIIMSPRLPATGPATNLSAASLSLVGPVGGTVDAGQTQNVQWTSKNYQLSTVVVSLIRKVASNPDRYAVVRTIAPSTANDGSATWVPATSDVGSGLSLQVGCVVSAQACTASVISPQLAVTNTGRFANTASAYSAIEQSNNK